MSKYQEAFDRIKEFGECVDFFGVAYYMEEERKKEIEIIQEAIEKANKYDELQTPVKPKITYDAYGRKECYCSTCGEILGPPAYAKAMFKYCPDCGNLLDWSDVK